MPKRKNVSWRVSEHPQSDLINDWLDQQKNIQDSITNIVLHMIDRFGVRNITDYDVQKILYQESSAAGEDNSIREEITQDDSKKTHNKAEKIFEHDEDDPFGKVDPKNI